MRVCVCQKVRARVKLNYLTNSIQAVAINSLTHKQKNSGQRERDTQYIMTTTTTMCFNRFDRTNVSVLFWGTFLTHTASLYCTERHESTLLPILFRNIFFSISHHVTANAGSLAQHSHIHTFERKLIIAI